ncbi:hypothetical protein EVAR_46387_1 [Eumeta japonica]|uniref:Uncharacterized protein n=1 Tax=Eumeta variegata TaxID=151549 RepID=A0A4C1WW25_EUMVA|nr:hypothetical protein EVAR_46387_1 [Eumeta japonica]
MRLDNIFDKNSYERFSSVEQRSGSRGVQRFKTSSPTPTQRHSTKFRICKTTSAEGRKKVSIALEENGTPTSLISNNIETNDIDNAIGSLTSHMTKVVKTCARKVPVNFDHRKLPADVRRLMRAKNAALHRTSAFPTLANKSYAHAL